MPNETQSPERTALSDAVIGRVTPAEAAAARRQASEMGITVSQFVRLAVTAYRPSKGAQRR